MPTVLGAGWVGSSANTLDEVDLVTVNQFNHPQGGGRVATAVQNGQGRLEVTVWDYAKNGAGFGNLLDRKGTEAGPAIEKVAATLWYDGIVGKGVVTGVIRAEDKKLEVTYLEVTSDGDFGQKHKSLAKDGEIISKVAIASIKADRVVTAVRDSGHDLKVIVWDLETFFPDPKPPVVKRVGDSGNAAAGIDDVAIAGWAKGVVTAVRTEGNNELKLIAWEITPEGKVVRKGDSGHDAGIADKIAIVQVSEHRVVTAVRQHDQSLKIIVWDIKDKGEITRKHSHSPQGDNNIQAVAITRLGPDVAVNTQVAPAQVAIAAVRPSGKLWITSWDVGDNGTLTKTTDTTDNDFTPIHDVAVTPLGNGIWNGGPTGQETPMYELLTAVRDGSNKLRLYFWRSAYQAAQP